MLGQIYVERDNKEIVRVNNSIHPQFRANLATFTLGDYNTYSPTAQPLYASASALNDSKNWVIDRFLFFENKIDNISNPSSTGVNIGTLVSKTFEINGFILNVKMRYNIATSYTINGIVLANQYQSFNYAYIRGIENIGSDELRVQVGEIITFGWQLDITNGMEIDAIFGERFNGDL